MKAAQTYDSLRVSFIDCIVISDIGFSVLKMIEHDYVRAEKIYDSKGACL